MRYQSKPYSIEASQWFAKGDHPSVGDLNLSFLSVDQICKNCSKPYGSHGFIESREGGGHIVCPGDYVVKSWDDSYFPCNPKYFEEKYEEAK